MIYVNGDEFKVGHFPDGTQALFDVKMPQNGSAIVFRWEYENDEEMVTLMYLVRHFKENMPFLWKNTAYRLIMRYVPNARMDRTKKDTEVFTLKYFCEFINSLEFDEVIILDPHSNVTPALLNHVRIEKPEPFISYAIQDIEGWDIDGGASWGGRSYIYFPDEGAMKRYGDLSCFGQRTKIYGHKKRNWSTGEIIGLEIFDANGEHLKEKALDGEVVLMVDDIISYGGTLAYSADKLKEYGASAIYAYASHTENSILDAEKGKLLERLKLGVVDGIFTTDSIFKGESDYITIIDEV